MDEEDIPALEPVRRALQLSQQTSHCLGCVGGVQRHGRRGEYLHHQLLGGREGESERERGRGREGEREGEKLYLNGTHTDTCTHVRTYTHTHTQPKAYT